MFNNEIRRFFDLNYDTATIVRPVDRDLYDDYRVNINAFRRTHYPFWYRNRFAISLILMLIGVGIVVYALVFKDCNCEDQFPIDFTSSPIVYAYIGFAFIVLGLMTPTLRLTKERQRKIAYALHEDRGLRFFIKERRIELYEKEKAKLEKIRDELKQQIADTENTLSLLNEEQYNKTIVDEFMERV